MQTRRFQALRFRWADFPPLPVGIPICVGTKGRAQACHAFDDCHASDRSSSASLAAANECGKQTHAFKDAILRLMRPSMQSPSIIRRTDSVSLGVPYGRARRFRLAVLFSASKVMC